MDTTPQKKINPIPDDKPIAMMTAGELWSFIESKLHGAGGVVDDDAPRPTEAICAMYDGVTEGWLRSHVKAEGRGARRCRLYRPSAVLAAMSACPVAPRALKKARPTGENLDPIDQMLASGELVARGGR
jgi:hypothetical protein